MYPDAAAFTCLQHSVSGSRPVQVVLVATAPAAATTLPWSPRTSTRVPPRSSSGMRRDGPSRSHSRTPGRSSLSRLRPGEQFVYVFDLGDDWAHLCTVGAQRIDPVEALGILPGKPLPYWGWGDIPDQYRRQWDGDDGESPQPTDPGSPIFHRFGLTGGPPADRRSPGSRHSRRAPYPPRRCARS